MREGSAGYSNLENNEAIQIIDSYAASSSSWREIPRNP